VNQLPKELKGRKVSEVFLEFIDPYFRDYLAGMNKTDLKQLEEMLKVPWMIWNAHFLSKDPNNKIDFTASIQLTIKNQAIEHKKLISLMHERKKTLFDQYNYLLGEIKLTFVEKSSEVRLSVEARVMPKSQ